MSILVLAFAMAIGRGDEPDQFRSCVDTQITFLADHYRYRADRAEVEKTAREILALCSVHAEAKRQLTPKQIKAETKRIAPRLKAALNDSTPAGDVLNAQD